MRSKRSHSSLSRALPALATFILALGACGGVQVRTLVAPDANFSGRNTFHLLRARARATGQRPSNDPMLDNPITNERIRTAIRSAMEKRGYRYVESGASIGIAYYAAARQKLDVRNWDYGYGWRRFPRQRTEVYEYTEGTVIVDAVDPSTHTLLWRGQGRSAVSDDPDQYAKDLEKTIDAIVAKLPAPTQ
jgi:hypothetical protein